MKKTTTQQLIVAALCLALGLLLPLVFHSLGMSGSVFSPMHLPVFLCGLICGYQYGFIVGLIIPFLSSFLTGMPLLFPVAVYMATELATYGLVSGLLVHKCHPLLTLIVAMLCGRVVLGVSQFILLGLTGTPFALGTFLTTAFITGLPGILLQLILIPTLLYTLKKTSIT